MRESLFRAAQKEGYFPSEEPVGQKQRDDLTAECYELSLTPFSFDRAPEIARPPLVLWPYPRGTADCYDRARCASAFVDANDHFRVVTELGLRAVRDGDDVLASDDPLVVFASFEECREGLAIDEAGAVTLWGRRCDAVLSELVIAYLLRYGHLSLDPNRLQRPGSGPTPGTSIVNGSTYALHKGMQADHFRRYAESVPTLSALDHAVAAKEDELEPALDALSSQGMAAVVRPFGGSQGSGIAFVAVEDCRRETATVVSKRVAEQIAGSMTAKYGAASAFPLTVSPFEQSVLLDGCVTDLRIFVVADEDGFRALPGMVRRAQVPIHACERLCAACGMTNLNAPRSDRALVGPRIFPLTAESTLMSIGVDEKALIDLCGHASRLWAEAFSDERALFAGTPSRQFAYGSVDFIIRASDRSPVPIEMNGANVGSHPTVHPRHAHLFGSATSRTLANLGLSRWR